MLKKFLIFSFFVGLSYISNAQTTALDNYVTEEVNQVDLKLSKASNSLKLNEAQKVKLEAIFIEREAKKKSHNLQGLDKYGIYKLYQSIDEEYYPAIEKILSLEQRAAFRKLKPKYD